MKILLFLLFILLVNAACQKKTIQPAPEEDCNFVQNVYGERISWKNQLPIPLYINSSVPSEYFVAIEKATQAWESAAGQKLFKIVGTRNSATPSKDGFSEIFFLDSWEEDKRSEQGRTSIYWVGDLIYEADIRINQKDFEYFISGQNSAGVSTSVSNRAIDLESLLIHELGHVLGLKHREDSGSVMATYLPGNTSRNQIATADVESLQCEY